MAFEFDHLFICTDPGAVCAKRLMTFGLTEGSPNTHPGQGTANRRFFFHNAKLELLWVCNPTEAQSEVIRRTRLWERWRDRHSGACPFGICLRSVGSSGDSENAIAFPSWAYRPPYLSATTSIAIGTNSDKLTEPMLFQTPFGQRPASFPPEKSQPLEHAIELREVTRVELVSPVASDLSSEFQAAIAATSQLKLRQGTKYLVKLGFDLERQGKQVDFQPDLPLIISW